MPLISSNTHAYCLVVFFKKKICVKNGSTLKILTSSSLQKITVDAVLDAMSPGLKVQVPPLAQRTPMLLPSWIPMTPSAGPPPMQKKAHLGCQCFELAAHPTVQVIFKIINLLHGCHRASTSLGLWGSADYQKKKSACMTGKILKCVLMWLVEILYMLHTDTQKHGGGSCYKYTHKFMSVWI